MIKRGLLVFLLLIALAAQSQVQNDSIATQDSIKKNTFIKQLGNGYFPTKVLNFDLRYLVKFNQYEGFRTGLGGVTNDGFSEKYRINSYVVYGFVDKKIKYSIGGGFRIAPETKTWINVAYTDDLQETGSSKFLTDKRFFSFFEPRLLNIDLFHKHITTKVALEHEINPKLLSEVEFATSNIRPTYDYNYLLNGESFGSYETTTAKIALQWNPRDEYDTESKKIIKEGYPKFTLQYTKSFKDILNADFNFSKLDFRTIHKVNHNKESFSITTFSAGLAQGDAPLTHLYHAYPNNITKETILQRFSVAGINSFETMYFNEFFSDRFATLIFKHYLKPFHISKNFNPQLVLISRFAFGDMTNKNRHQNITFNTLNKGYTESGFEINKLLFGFGLSFSYRYGAYHLPRTDDNIAFKFTFNITL
ncbi:DUF5686 family protein [Pontimicrobium sp. MEBiC01747]